MEVEETEVVELGLGKVEGEDRVWITFPRVVRERLMFLSYLKCWSSIS